MSKFDEYATVSELSSYATTSSLSGYALLNVPSGTSQIFTGDNMFDGKTTIGDGGNSLHVKDPATFYGNVKISAGWNVHDFTCDAYATFQRSASFQYPVFFLSNMCLGSNARLILGSWSSSGNNTIEFPSLSGTLALTRDIPSLSEYATQSWVTTQISAAERGMTSYVQSVTSDMATKT